MDCFVASLLAMTKLGRGHSAQVAFASDQASIDGCDRRRFRIEAEFLLDALPRPHAHRACRCDIAHQGFERSGQCICISGWNENTGDAILDYELNHLKWIWWTYWECAKCGRKHKDCDCGSKWLMYL